MQLALDKSTNDLFKPAGGGVTRTSEGRYTVQAVQSKLQTILGEWTLDPTVGWLNFADFEKNYNLFDIELRAREIILGTKGVLAIDEMDLAVSKRVLTLSFKATTIYGGISLTVPWTKIGT